MCACALVYVVAHSLQLRNSASELLCQVCIYIIVLITNLSSYSKNIYISDLKIAYHAFPFMCVGGLCSLWDGPVASSEGVIRNPARSSDRYDNNQ